MKHVKMYEGKTDDNCILVADYLADKFLKDSEYIFDYTYDPDDDIIYIVYYFEMIDQEQLDKYILPLIEYINTQGYSEYSEWSIFGGKDRKNNTDQFYVTTEIRLLAGDPFYKFIKDIRREKSTKRFGL